MNLSPGRSVRSARSGGSLLHVVVLLLFQLSDAQVDNRCFLIGGGSAENFFVSENATVGSVIGVLRISGDPGPQGDIHLQLSTSSQGTSAIAIGQNSKDIILVAQLDKEGLEGPSQVTASVTCDRRGSSAEPSLTIPVNIRVTDANDNAPVFQGGPYEVSVSESVLNGSVILQGIKASDADQPGPYSTVHFSVLPGPHSDYVDFASTLEGTLILRKPLDYETVQELNVSIRAQDQGNPPLSSETSVLIRILDADDQNPLFSRARYVAYLPQPALKGETLEMKPEALLAADQDFGINATIRYAWNGVGSEYKFFQMDAQNGTLVLTRDVPDNELVQPVTLVVKAYQVDNKDRYALTTVTVNRSSSFSPLLQFLQRLYNVAVLENIPVNTTLFILAVNRPGDRNVRFLLDRNGQRDGQFTVDRMGEVKLHRSLDFEAQNVHQFVIIATDGVSNDTAFVNLTVLNVNDGDPHFDDERYEFVITGEAKEASGPFKIGHIGVHDGDNDRVDLQLKGNDARAFSINQDGDLFLTDLSVLNSTSADFMIVGRDNGIPPRQTSVPVKVHLPADMVVSLGGSTWWPAEGNPLLLIVLGILLGLLCLIISALAIYVCHSKKKKPLSPLSPRVNPVYQSSDPPVTATLRRMPINPLARNSCRRIVPIATPTSPPLAPPPSAQSQKAADSGDKSRPKSDDSRTHPPGIVANGKRSESHLSEVVAWPSDAAPRRVKKLSWEDEYNVFF